ncbi:gliding motility-associated C-terminal domain-containing protein [Gelidibacter salicanalis]|uniref:Gliding motility-associated C-terminal domain-containing protein n=1 Tax=Gelidibacter salicanalis TaxID=291193 RepID=A0A5C7AGC4_9FLAO|nr:gliding motility-associated C-terminal domain-containing protein [Gelidibacter salicanalis]TXE07397.1 gliding motility-associated C-terminal domain-containing protein [Gelidibacter salicanalis]
MKKSLLQLSAFLLFTGGMMAQTTNAGMLYVSEGTQLSTLERFNNLTSGTFYNDGDVLIYSHFQNDGTVDFYKNSGLTRFIGTASQEISGSKTSFLYNAFFDNRSNRVPFNISGNLDISGQANLFSGILDNDNFGGEITFNTNGTHINTSNDSHVDGAVNKVGNTAFTFPIGDGGFYRLSGISAPANASAIFESKYYFENSNNLFSHDLKAGVILEIDNQEYWTITKQSAADEDMMITLSWNAATTPQSLLDAAAEKALTIVRWDEANNMWVDEGGAIDLNNNTVTTAVNGFGVVTLGRVESDLILPCGLVIYNSVTPNGDGLNDFFLIDQSNNDNCAKNIKVQVFNRWGVKVFETNDYGMNGNVFSGYSSGRLTLKDSEYLPSGTYFYIIEYQYGPDAENNFHKQAGYLYLSAN